MQRRSARGGDILLAMTRALRPLRPLRLLRPLCLAYVLCGLGCGRIGYDPGGGAIGDEPVDAAGGTVPPMDASSAPDALGPGTPRSDAAPGTGGMVLGPPVRITFTTGISGSPTITASDTGFAVAWQERIDNQYEIHFAALDAQGKPQAEPVPITSAAGDSMRPRLAWTGSAFGLAWDDNREGNHEVYFALLDAAGSALGLPSRLTTASGDSRYASVSWAGTGFLLTWEDFRSGVFQPHLVALDDKGVALAAEVILSELQTPATWVRSVWTGSELWVVWADARSGSTEIYFTRVSAAGVKLEPDELRVSALGAPSLDPRIAYAGGQLGVVWQDFRNNAKELYFASVTAGATQVTEVQLTSGADLSFHDLTYGNGEYGLVWGDRRDGNDEIYFLRLGLDGKALHDPLRVTVDPAMSSSPAVAWLQDHYVITWDDSRDGNTEIYTVTVTP
jgi:hypothetical protein